MQRPRVILDCDPGLDDAVAIALALHHADVVGISSVGGNVSLEHTTKNALALCDVLGRPDVPVHAGHDLPMSGSVAHRARQFHGPGGTGSVEFDPPARSATSDDAVTWMIDAVRSEPGIWVIATGPLTNVAHAIRRAPEIIDDIAGISWMGGSSTYGNRSPVAEFNAWADPEAVDVVINAGHPNLMMLGLNVTHTVLLDRTWIDLLRATVEGTQLAVFADLLDYYEARQRESSLLAGAAVHDALAVLRVTHPQLFAGVSFPVEVDTTDGPARGMTIVDQRPHREVGPTNVHVVEWADARSIRGLTFAALSHFPPPA